jgi:hypothetical protein
MNGDRSGEQMLESDQDRWLTYAEAGELLGISTQAARMLAKRRGWSRRTPNAYGDRAQVLVPAEAIVQPRSASLGVRTGSVFSGVQGEPNGHDHLNVQVLEQAIGVLRDQLETANRRADDDRARADRAEQKAATLQAEMIDLLISERSADELAEYASAEVADLRRRLDTAGEERRAEAAELRRQLAEAEEERRRLTGQQELERERADTERTRADQIEQQLTKVEGELIAARVEAASLQCQLELARPKAVPDSPRSAWRRFLVWRR